MHHLTLTLTFASEAAVNDAPAMLEESFAKEGHVDIAADELRWLGEKAQRVCLSITNTMGSRGLLPS